MFWFIVLAAIGGFAYYIFVKRRWEERDYEEEFTTQGEHEEMRRTRLNEKWRTVNTSSTLIKGAEGRRDAVLELIKQNLKESAVPNISVGERLVSITGIVGMYNGERKMLVIRNKQILGYSLFVSIADYGKQLNVSWYLMLKENRLTRLSESAEKNPLMLFWILPDYFMSKISKARSGATIPELMNMFDAEELSAFCTTVHHAVQEAVNEVAKDLHLNSAKIGWQTRGFLSID